MKKFAFLITILLLFCINVHSQYFKSTVRVGKDSEVSGYVDKNGNVAVPYGQYLSCISDTLDRYAIVMDYIHRYLGIDKYGRPLFYLYMWQGEPDEPKEGMFRIRELKENKIGFANTKGEIVVKPRFDYAHPFSDGMAAFNIDGKPFVVHDAMTVPVGDRNGYIDRTGEIVIPPIYIYTGNFNNGKAIVKNREKEWLIIDKSGQTLSKISFPADYIKDIKDGMAGFRYKDKWGYMDDKGNMVIPAQYDIAWDFSDGKAKVIIGNEKFFINKENKKVSQ